MNAEIKGLDELQKAIEKNPQTVKTELSRFFVRGLAVYRSGIKNQPWRVGGSGGGAPVRTGSLRDSHVEKIMPYQASIRPTAKYAAFVHGIEGYPRKRTYQLRPWLDFVKKDKQPKIDELAVNLLEKIVSQLAN